MRLARLIPACVACVGLTAFADDADLFKQLDSSGDGVVEKSEVGEERIRFFDRLLRVGDANDDGKLTESEFRAALADKPPEATASGQRGARGGDRRGPGAAGGREMPSPAEIVERLDTNGDGKIQRDELTGRAEMLGRVMDRLDTDELTVAQLEETRTRMREMMANGDRPEMGRPPEGRGRPDGDREMAERDGFRPRGSFRPEGGDGDFRPRGPESARRDGPPRGMEGDREHRHHEPPPFIALLDENHDGKITKLEAVRLIEKFNELDKNDDGSLDMPELMGDRPQGPPMSGRPDGDRRPGPPEGRRPGGDRPDMERRPGGDRPDGDRPEGDRRRGDRPGMEGRPGGEGRGFGSRGGDPGAFFDRLDADKSGGISKDEMPGFMAERFEMLDKNNDGEVTKDEMQRPSPGAGRGPRGGTEGSRGRPEGSGDRPRRPASEDAA